MALLDYHDLEELHNANEELVWKALERTLIDNPTFCRCRDCILDAAALALNSLPSRYQVFAFHNNDPQTGEPGADVVSAVTSALEQVRRRPHHA